MIKLTKQLPIYILSIFILIAVLLYWKRDRTPPDVATKPPVVVQLIVAEPKNWNVEVPTTGVIDVPRNAEIKAAVTGQITKIHVRSGQKVQANDLLFEINPEGLQKQLLVDTAQVELTIKQLDQALGIYKTGTGTKAQYDQALANYQEALATLAKTQQLFNLSQVIAPFSGTLGIFPIHEGDFVTLGQPLVNMKSNSEIHVDFAVPADYMGKLATGNKIKIKSMAYPDQELMGEVYAVDTEVDSNNNTVTARANILNPPPHLLDGSFVEVTVILAQENAVVAVPQTAIVYNAEGTAVYVVKNGVATQVLVQLGQRNGLEVAVLSGVKAGDTVIAVGKTKVSNGTRVVNVKAQ